jgi:hypothetical protein
MTTPAGQLSCTGSSGGFRAQDRLSSRALVGHCNEGKCLLTATMLDVLRQSPVRRPTSGRLPSTEARAILGNFCRPDDADRVRRRLPLRPQQLSVLRNRCVLLPCYRRERQTSGASGCEWGDSRPESTIKNGGADLKNSICAMRGPAHLSAFVHPGVDQIVHKAIGERRGNRFPFPPPPAVVDHRIIVVLDIGSEIPTQLGETPRLRFDHRTVQQHEIARHRAPRAPEERHWPGRSFAALRVQPGRPATRVPDRPGPP